VSRPLAAVVLVALASSAAGAQGPIAERVRAAGTRTVAFTTRARPEVCGDGVDVVSDGLGGEMQFYNEYYDGSTWTRRPCVHGPLRIAIRVVDGVPSRVRVIAGPLPTLGDTVVDLGVVSTADAGAYLRTLARGDQGRVSEQALLPLLLVDSVPRWEILAAAARDTSHMMRYRRRASDLLARGAASTLGAAGRSDDPAAVERRAVVAALAARRTRDSDPVPDLIEIARANRHPDARAAAIRQLGQTADPRAIDLFAALLRLPGS
jgi:hypothetical protein